LVSQPHRLAGAARRLRQHRGRAPERAPARTDIPHIDREEVVVLSDWTNENPNDVMRTLLRGSDWYAIRKGTAQSLVGAIQAGNLKDYLNREKSRLPPMDVSDVAYDAFLVNGKPRQRLAAQAGRNHPPAGHQRRRLNLFLSQLRAGPLTIIAADGIDVAPIHQKRLLIGMAETYDVLVTVPRIGRMGSARDRAG
jgi:FtsP/CotA-like multicopper oxidase with cupredoxin domain